MNDWIVGVGVPVGIALAGGLVGWMFKVQSLLSAISASLKVLPDLIDKVDGHAERISALESTTRITKPRRTK